MSDAKICKKCAEKGKAGIAEPHPVPVAAPGPGGSVVTETVTVYVCGRCGNQTQG